MKSELQITFKNLKPSESIEKYIRAKAAKLESFYAQLIGCHVAIEVPHRHHTKGSPFHIRIDLTVPGGEIVVKREPTSSARARQSGEREIKKHAELNMPHKDFRVTINDAFKAAGRRLQDYARRQRGDTKTQAMLPEARVSEIQPSGGYGFLASDDGREIYFHKNSVLGRAFPRLKVGTVVRFAEELGDKGPQASTVRIVSNGGVPKGAAKEAHA